VAEFYTRRYKNQQASNQKTKKNQQLLVFI